MFRHTKSLKGRIILAVTILTASAGLIGGQMVGHAASTYKVLNTDPYTNSKGADATEGSNSSNPLQLGTGSDPLSLTYSFGGWATANPAGKYHTIGGSDASVTGAGQRTWPWNPGELNGPLINSSAPDKPNATFSKGGNDYQTLFGNYNGVTQTKGSLGTTSGLMVAASNLYFPNSNTSGTGGTSSGVFADSAFDDVSKLTNVQSATGSKITLFADGDQSTITSITSEFDSYFPAAQAESQTNGNEMFHIHNLITGSILVNGSMYVHEQSTNESGDLTKAHLGRILDTDMEMLPQGQYDVIGTDGDKIPLRAMGNYTGIYESGADVTNYPNVRLNFQMDVQDGPQAWKAAYFPSVRVDWKANPNSTTTGTSTGFSVRHIDSANNSIGGFSGSDPNGVLSGPDKDPNAIYPTTDSSGDSDSAILMRWDVGDWKKGDSKDTGYVMGVVNSDAPMITLSNPDKETIDNPGTDISLAGTITDTDALSSKKPYEHFKYQVDKLDNDGKTWDPSTTLTDLPTKPTDPYEMTTKGANDWQSSIPKSDIDDSTATYKVTIYAIDDDGQKSNEESFRVVPNPDKDVPILDLTNKDIDNPGAGTPIDLTGSITDPDETGSEQLSYSIDNNNYVDSTSLGTDGSVAMTNGTGSFGGDTDTAKPSIAAPDNDKNHTVYVWAEDSDHQWSNVGSFVVKAANSLGIEETPNWYFGAHSSQEDLSGNNADNAIQKATINGQDDKEQTPITSADNANVSVNNYMKFSANSAEWKLSGQFIKPFTSADSTKVIRDADIDLNYNLYAAKYDDNSTTLTAKGDSRTQSISYNNGLANESDGNSVDLVSMNGNTDQNFILGFNSADSHLHIPSNSLPYTKNGEQTDYTATIKWTLTNSVN